MSLSIVATIALIIASFVGATISGVIGMGGGMVLLGVMTSLLPAAAVVPLHGVVQLSANATRTVAFVRHVHWRIFLTYVIPASLGVYLATLLWSGSKMDWFKPLVGVFILTFLVWRRYSPKLRNVPLWVYAPVGVVVGFLAIFVGATGPFLAPFFLRDDFKKEQVIATKAACQFSVHLWKIPAFIAMGFDYAEYGKLLAILVIAVIVGTYVGKHLLKKMSERFFLILFQFVLTFIALYLVTSAFLG